MLGSVYSCHYTYLGLLTSLTKYHGSLAEWSKALVLGTSPKGRGFESILFIFVCHLDSFLVFEGSVAPHFLLSSCWTTAD